MKPGPALAAASAQTALASTSINTCAARRQCGPSIDIVDQLWKRLAQRCALLLGGLALLALSGCGSAPKVGASVPAGMQEQGLASYYGQEFQGRKTASGERYDAALLTAAHRTLPLGTRVKVTNAQQGKSVVVRINDRGPFVKGRVLDLSRAAFRAIANLNDGVVSVRLQVLD